MVSPRKLASVKTLLGAGWFGLSSLGCRLAKLCNKNTLVDGDQSKTLSGATVERRRRSQVGIAAKQETSLWVCRFVAAALISGTVWHRIANYTNAVMWSGALARWRASENLVEY